MSSQFLKIGDIVTWNSEAGHVSGRIRAIHTTPFLVNGYQHHATSEQPQYEILSLKTNHIAFHKRKALTFLEWFKKNLYIKYMYEKYWIWFSTSATAYLSYISLAWSFLIACRMPNHLGVSWASGTGAGNWWSIQLQRWLIPDLLKTQIEAPQRTASPGPLSKIETCIKSDKPVFHGDQTSIYRDLWWNWLRGPATKENCCLSAGSLNVWQRS